MTEATDFKVEKTHSGQKKAYGDSYSEFTVKSEMPADEVESYCTEHVYKCGLTDQQWRDDEKSKRSIANHFRSRYVFKKVSDGEYFYQIIFPYAD